MALARSSGFIVSAGLALAAMLASAPVCAQGGPGSGAPASGALPSGAVGGTVTGAPPSKAASTTAVGQTKPAGSAVGDRLGTRPDLQRESDKIDRTIQTGICTGCK